MLTQLKLLATLKEASSAKPVGAADSCVGLTGMTKGHTGPQAEYCVTSTRH